MVMGTIVGIHIDDAVIKDGQVDVRVYQPVARLGYKDYSAIGDVFELTP
jgi:flavin reductase (DIM6/NTAB) family NADH-FMN oxidoreductase RutF